MASPCIFIAGPTATGKSEIALLLAEKIGGEIISVDSMQVYRGLDIGTAKPDAATRKKIQHHLIDVCGLNEPFDAAKFVQLANQAVAEIQSRHKTPIFCGGTGLYFKAFLDGLGEAPPADPKLRAELEAAPVEELLRELQEGDPAAYEKIDKKNPRRVIRALEVIRTTGRSFSSQRAELAGASSRAGDAYICLRVRPVICGGGLMFAWRKCFAAGWWRRRRNCLSVAWRKIKRRCRRSVTGRWWNICAGNIRCHKPWSW